MSATPLVLLLSLLLAPVLRAEHVLEPRELELGHTARYLVRTPSTESVAALAATTVHAPAGDGLVVEDSWVRYHLEQGHYQREDGFLLRPTRAGTLEVKPALVEGPEVALAAVEGLELVVRPPGEDPLRRSLGLTGLLLLLPAAYLLYRRLRPPPRGGEAEGTQGGADPRELLAPCRESRLQGDVREFYIRLYGILRDAVGSLSGRRPRDPKGFVEVGRQLGLSAPQLEILRKLATVCERVVFGGEEVSPGSLVTSYEGAEDVLVHLHRIAQAPGDPAAPNQVSPKEKTP